MEDFNLESIRSEIDSIDDKIIELVSRRYALVDKAVRVKKQHNIALYSKEREAFLLDHFKALADKYDLPDDMLRDILKRFLRQSYEIGDKTSFACAATKGDKIVIVGGRGGMGRLFGRYLESASYNVSILDRDDWDRADEIVADALCVIVSVPIDITCHIIEKISPYLDGRTVLCDLTSVKVPVCDALKRFYKGPSLSLHPMFGPDTKGFVKQVVVSIPVCMPEKTYFFSRQLELFGARVYQCSAQEHDEAMSIIQALRHFTTYCYGVFLCSLNADIRHILDLSSPIYRLELSMVGRLFAQDPILYGDIIMSSKGNLKLIKSYAEALNHELVKVAEGDIDSFVAKFNEAKAYFGSYADMFLKESAVLLSKYQDQR